MARRGGFHPRRHRTGLRLPLTTLPLPPLVPSRLSGCLPPAALTAIRQRVAAWQLQQPHGAAAAPPARPPAPERHGSSSPPTIPTAALLRALGGAAAAAQHDTQLQPSTPVVHTSTCHGPSGAAASSRPDGRQPTSSSSQPGLAAMPAARGSRADHQTTARKPEQPAATATKAGSKQHGGKWGSPAGCGCSTSAAGAAVLWDRHSSRSARSRAKGSSLALAAGCLPLSALLLLLLVRGLAEAPAGGLDMVLTSTRAWWLACSWAASAALLCTHAAYVRAGWRWAVALDACYLLMLAGG